MNALFALYAENEDGTLTELDYDGYARVNGTVKNGLILASFPMCSPDCERVFEATHFCASIDGQPVAVGRLVPSIRISAKIIPRITLKLNHNQPEKALMEPTKTIDELIARLHELRARSGGDCRVMLRTYGRELMYAHCSLGATGKKDEYRTVTRGGTPCVILSE